MHESNNTKDKNSWRGRHLWSETIRVARETVCSFQLVSNSRAGSAHGQKKHRVPQYQHLFFSFLLTKLTWDKKKNNQKKSNIHACTITQEYLHTGKRSPADAAVWNDGDVGGVPAQQNSPIGWVKLEMMNGITSVSNTCDGSQVRTATVTGFLETACAGWATASKLGAGQGRIPPHKHSFVSSTDESSEDQLWPFNRRITTHIKPKQRRTDLVFISLSLSHLRALFEATSNVTTVHMETQS